MKTDHQEIRFGVIAVKKGFVKPDQVVYALSVQVSEDLKSGQHRPIGTILLDQEIITLKQFEEVIHLMDDYDDMGSQDDGLVESHHSGGSRHPDQPEPYDVNGFRPPPE